jgi:hypothetical protein
MEVLVHSTTAFKLEDMHESQVPHGQFETYTASKTRDVEPASLHGVRSSGVRVSPLAKAGMEARRANEHRGVRARRPAHMATCTQHTQPSPRQSLVCRRAEAAREQGVWEGGTLAWLKLQPCRACARGPAARAKRSGGRAGSTWTTNRPRCLVPGSHMGAGTGMRGHPCRVASAHDCLCLAMVIMETQQSAQRGSGPRPRADCWCLLSRESIPTSTATSDIKFVSLSSARACLGVAMLLCCNCSTV